MDAIGQAVDQWRRERPDLGDPGLTAMASMARLGRLAARMQHEVEGGLAASGLKAGEFDVLASLRRSGDPFELTPGALVRQLLLSSGAMTNRLDRLEHAGFIRRRPDPDDRRGVIVGLTAAGRRRIDDAVVEHVANEARLLSALTDRERAAFDRAVLKLLDSFDD